MNDLIDLNNSIIDYLISLSTKLINLFPLSQLIRQKKKTKLPYKINQIIIQSIKYTIFNQDKIKL